MCGEFWRQLLSNKETRCTKALCNKLTNRILDSYETFTRQGPMESSRDSCPAVGQEYQKIYDARERLRSCPWHAIVK